MSTRAQVTVISEGLGWDDRVTLYHHFDGYPSNIIPLIKKSQKLASYSYMNGRAGKVASFLCATDPGEFEPESGHTLHGDIEYYYKLFLVNTQGGTMAEKPKWELEILIPDREKNFWDNSIEGNMKVKTSRRVLSRVSNKD